MSAREKLLAMVAKVGGSVTTEPKAWPERGHMVVVNAPDGCTWDEDLDQYVCPNWKDAYERTAHAIEKMGGPFPAE